MIFDFCVLAQDDEKEHLVYFLEELSLNRYVIEHTEDDFLTGYGFAIETIEEAISKGGPVQRLLNYLSEQYLDALILIGDPKAGVSHFFSLKSSEINEIAPVELGLDWDKFWDLKRQDSKNYYALGLKALYDRSLKILETRPKENKLVKEEKRKKKKVKQAKKENVEVEKVSLKTMAISFVLALIISAIGFLVTKQAIVRFALSENFVDFILSISAGLLVFLILFIGLSLILSKFLDKKQKIRKTEIIEKENKKK